MQLQVLLVALERAGRVLDEEERRGLALVVEEIGLRRREPARNLALSVGRAALDEADNLGR